MVSPTLSTELLASHLDDATAKLCAQQNCAAPARLRQNTKQSGFTLIELMVVIVIIAVMAGLSTLSVGGNDMRRLKAEANRLQRLIDLARDEALFRQQNFGLYLDQGRYFILIFNPTTYLWQKSSEESFAPYTLPENFEAEILIDGEAMQMPIPEEVLESWEDNDEIDTEALLTPQILMLASGESTPFEIRLSLTNGSELEASISSDGFSNTLVEIQSEAH